MKTSWRFLARSSLHPRRAAARCWKLVWTLRWLVSCRRGGPNRERASTHKLGRLTWTLGKYSSVLLISTALVQLVSGLFSLTTGRGGLGSSSWTISIVIVGSDTTSFVMISRVRRLRNTFRHLPILRGLRAALGMRSSSAVVRVEQVPPMVICVRYSL